MQIPGSKKLFYWSVAGCVILIVGVILAFVIFPIIVDDQIYRQIKLENGTDQYERWRELPVALEFKIYFFNITNFEDVDNGAYPEVEEIGPYVYREFHLKTNITYDEQEDTYTYLQYTHYEFDYEASYPLSDNDRIWTMNAPLNAVLQIANRYLPEILMGPVLDAYWPAMFPDASPTSMFHNPRVGDMLFDGYKFCQPEGWALLSGLLCVVAALLDIKFLEMQDDFSITFSYFGFKQNKHDGWYTINAGIKDPSKLGLIQAWNGHTYQDIWGDRYSHCNKIKGRDGTIYPPGLKEDEDFEVYSTEICRIGLAVYDGKMTLQGIDAHRRVLGWNTFADPANYPDNYCYCGKYERDLYGNKACLPDGFADLTPCHIAPVIASNPHFLYANDTYAATVSGLTPNKEDHETFLAVEPITGTPVEGRKRVQFNMILRKIPGITVTNKLASSVLPIAWIEEGVVIPTDLANYFKGLFYTALTAVEVVKWLIIAIGALLFLICGGLYIYKLKKFGPIAKTVE